MKHWKLIVLAVLCGFLAIWIWQAIVIYHERNTMFGGVRASIAFGLVGMIIQWRLALLASFSFYGLFFILCTALRLVHTRD